MFTCMMQAQVDSSEQLHAFEKRIQCIPYVGLLHCAHVGPLWLTQAKSCIQ